MKEKKDEQINNALAQFDKTKEKNNLTSKQSKMGHKEVLIVRDCPHVQ